MKLRHLFLFVVVVAVMVFSSFISARTDVTSAVDHSGDLHFCSLADGPVLSMHPETITPTP